MKPNTPAERLYNGIIKENPTFVLMLGMCPTLAITTSATNGIGMGLTTTVILAASNLMISLLRNFIPDRVRMPAFIVVVASFVTVVQLLLQGFIPSLYDSLGIYIPLIVVNCIILGRAESYASKNPVLPSIFDGIGMGLGFTFGLTCIGLIRELLGAGQIFGFQIWSLPAKKASASGGSAFSSSLETYRLVKSRCLAVKLSNAFFLGNTRSRPGSFAKRYASRTNGLSYLGLPTTSSR